MARALQAIQRQSKEKGPTTDDELHAWILKNLKMNIPRVSVCDDHQAPFNFIADLYFERVTSAVAMANRGGSKTMSSAILHLLNSLYKPGCESLTVGAIEAQSKRAYENLKKLLIQHGGKGVFEPKDHPEIVRSIESETRFKNNSLVEIVPGTMAAVSGPHNQKVHADEQDQMAPDVWQQSRHVSQSKTILNDDGTETVIKAQDWVTSTRQRPYGPMQKLIDEVLEAERNGHKPPWNLYVWCVYETAKPVANCMIANPNLSEEKHCGCDKIVKGKWEDGSPRRFSDCCKGKLAKSQGFVELDNIHKRFQSSDQSEWEAQQECSKPEVGGMVFKTWEKKRYGIKWWSPDPDLGPIYQGVDFGGGTSPAAVNWYQVINRDIAWWGIDQSRADEPQKILKAGTRICFDEIYIAEIGNNELGLRVKERENEYKKIYSKFHVERRFVDPANKASRHDWNAMGLKTQFLCTRDIKEQIRTCNTILKDDAFAYDDTKCKMFTLEADSYHYPEKKPTAEYDPEIPIDDFNHCLDFNTLVQTRGGILKAGELENITVDVLTQDGTYKPAFWKSYGKAELYEVEFENGEKVRATENHRWPILNKNKIESFIPTIDIKGKIIPYQAARWEIKDAASFQDGCRHGMIFGDGTIGNLSSGYSYSWMNQYGEEMCEVTERIFGKENISKRIPSVHLDVKIRTKCFPYEYKLLPNLNEDPDYLRGFIAGLIASDGCVSSSGACTISQTENIDEIIDICRRVGIVVTSKREIKTYSGQYSGARKNYIIHISRFSLDDDLLLKPSHKSRRKNAKIRSGVKVVSVTKLEKIEEVYCCEELETGTFTLGNGILTGNSMSNFRYVMENLKYLERRGSIIGKIPTFGDRIYRTARGKSPIKSSASRYMPRNNN